MAFSLAVMANRKKLNKQCRKRNTLASKADKYELYQRSVQEPECDVEFSRDLFESRFGRPAHLLREDFCGTAAISCDWVRADAANRSWGIDLDPEPLDWGTKHNIGQLDSDQGGRIKLLRADVRSAARPTVDVVMALNFSFFVFKSRAELVAYFRVARENLADEGLLVLDAYGGPGSQQLSEEEIDHDDFSYFWDQDDFDPITHGTRTYIHFGFADGSKLQRAFSYNWRLWMLPEIREALIEAGFDAAEVYWEGADEDGEGDGVYTLQERAEAEEAWVAYIVGVKGRATG